MHGVLVFSDPHNDSGFDPAGNGSAQAGRIKLRFLAEQRNGVNHDYLLELTLSGRDLSTAISVFKRLDYVRKNVVSIAEIPGTRVQHLTDNPIVIPPPKLLVEG